jgi:CubicO group peptidase (beta-lactamase class C family)
MRTHVALSAVASLVSLSFSSRPADACSTRYATAADAVDAVTAAYGSQTIGMCVVGIGAGATAPKCVGEVTLGTAVTPTPTSLWGIGSITKTMAATLLALRDSQSGSGSTLATSLAGYTFLTGYSIPNASQITLLSLAIHKSGLPRAPNPDPNPQDLDELYQDVALCTGDPTCWDSTMGSAYSNYAYSLLGSVLAQQSGATSWAADNRASIMTPLGMTYTRTRAQFSETTLLGQYYSSHVVMGYIRQNNMWLAQHPVDPPPALAAAGGLYSSLDDMTLWLKYNMGLLGPSSLASLLPAIRQKRANTGPTTGIGLSWNIESDPCEGVNGKSYSKSGNVAGFNSYITYDHVAGRGVVVLLNVDPGSLQAETVGEELLHTLP